MKPLIIAILFPVLLLAQKDTIRHRYYYKMTINDSVLSNHSDLFVLNIGSASTEFKNIHHFDPPAVSVMRSDGQVRVSGTGAPVKNFIRTAIYRDSRSHQFKTVEELLMRFLITDSIPAINWTILPDTANMGGLSCQKARGLVCGRFYTVFFAKEIPLPFGPWKLGGLPGLIASAQDDRQEFSFVLVSADSATQKANGETNIVLPGGNGFKSVSREEYVQHTRLYQSNFNEYMKMQMGGDVTFVPKEGFGTSSKPVAVKVVMPLFCRIECYQ